MEQLDNSPVESVVFRNLINGEWIEPRSGRLFQTHNPADTEMVVGAYPLAERTQAESAFEAARLAFPAWSKMPAPKRGEILFRAAEILLSKADRFAREMTLEEGKTLPEAKGEVARAINIFRYFGGEAARLAGETLPSEREGVFCFTARKPRGVVSLITPWNFPIAHSSVENGAGACLRQYGRHQAVLARSFLHVPIGGSAGGGRLAKRRVERAYGIEPRDWRHARRTSRDPSGIVHWFMRSG